MGMPYSGEPLASVVKPAEQSEAEKAADAIDAAKAEKEPVLAETANAEGE